MKTGFQMSCIHALYIDNGMNRSALLMRNALQERTPRPVGEIFLPPRTLRRLSASPISLILLFNVNACMKLSCISLKDILNCFQASVKLKFIKKQIKFNPSLSPQSHRKRWQPLPPLPSPGHRREPAHSGRTHRRIRLCRLSWSADPCSSRTGSSAESPLQ